MPVVTCPQCGAKNRVDERAGRLQPVCGRCGAHLSADGRDGRAAAAGAGQPSAHPVTVTDETFETDVLGAGATPVLLDCWAQWCGPCRMLAPTLDQLAAESAGRYVVAKLNVDENPGVATRFQVSSIPTLLLFKGGQLVDRIVGLQPKAALAAKLGRYAQNGS